jgi:DNA-binding PadR family transcriptional regulator
MPRREHIGEFEQIVLLAVLRLGDDAYGVPIRQEIEKRTGRSLTVGALYRTFDRLEDKGYLTSWFSDPTAARGGRSRRYFKIAPAGVRALRESREALTAMWDGLEARVRHGS